MTNTNEAKALPTRWNSDLATAITGVTKSGETLAGRYSVTIDLLVASGMLWTDFISPKSEGSTATTELQAAIKESIIKGMPAVKRKLLATPAKALDEDGKVAKRIAQQSVGAYMGGYAKHLKIRAHGKAESKRAAQQSKGEADTTEVPKAQATAAKVLESILQAGKRAQADEAPTYDVVALVDLLAKAVQIVNTPAEPKH